MFFLLSKIAKGKDTLFQGKQGYICKVIYLVLTVNGMQRRNRVYLTFNETVEWEVEGLISFLTAETRVLVQLTVSYGTTELAGQVLIL